MKSINLDITHRCTLECSRCERIRWTARGEKVPGEDMELYTYLKILNYFDHINFCGNRADPVFNPNFIQFLALNKKRNKSCEIHNAATGKNLAWYQRAFKANTDAVWHFGIDGLPEKSHLYRKNQNGKKLYEAMLLCKKMGLKTIWNHIIFKYNEDDLHLCAWMAEEHGIEIRFIKSSRFFEKDPLKPVHPHNYIKREGYDKAVPEMFKP